MSKRSLKIRVGSIPLDSDSVAYAFKGKPGKDEVIAAYNWNDGKWHAYYGPTSILLDRIGWKGPAEVAAWAIDNFDDVRTARGRVRWVGSPAFVKG